MKQNKHTNKATAQAALLNQEEYYTGSLSELPESTAEPKGKILSWHWEPMHETFVMPKKVKGAA